MLTRVAGESGFVAPVLSAYISFLVKMLIEHDVGA